ncbi:hotdog fold thioesterase [Thermodesulfobacteriota bacterium]
MTENSRQKAINEHIQNDPFAKNLGAVVEILGPGHSRVSLTVTEDMTNFHGMIHGGIIFSVSDFAFAAASNSRGQTAVALNVNISFLRACKPGDQLVAEAIEQHAAGPTALYDISVIDKQTGELVAQSQDLVYRKRDWFVPE